MTGQQDSSTKSFYYSRPRLIHIASNIALSPILLYLLGIWPWPPTLPHIIVFVIATVIAVRYVQKRWANPQMVIDQEAIRCGEVYPFEDITNVEQIMRSLRITIKTGEGEQTKVLGLNWSKRDDFAEIVNTVKARITS